MTLKRSRSAVVTQLSAFVGYSPARMAARNASAGNWRVLATCAYFALATLALIHPAFTWLGDRIEPRFMGLPFSLVYVLGWIGLNSLVLIWMYRARLVAAEEET